MFFSREPTNNILIFFIIILLNISCFIVLFFTNKVVFFIGLIFGFYFIFLFVGSIKGKIDRKTICRPKTYYNMLGTTYVTLHRFYREFHGMLLN